MKNHFYAAPFLLAAGAAYAQVTPDAGALQQQIDQSRRTALPKPAPRQLETAPVPMQSLAGPSVTVNTFKFAGNTLLSSQQLAAVVAPYLNRPLSFRELQAAALAVGSAYREAGWIARAYLPRQEVDGGVVTIQVIEAVFGGVRVDGDGRIDAGQATRIVERALPAGTLLNADALDRAILLVDDLPGTGATGNLVAGERDNETALALRLTPEPLANGDVGIDNTGSRSTGAARATANVYLNSPARLGDQGTVNLIHSDGSDYLRAAYSLPVGDAGWRAGVNASTLRYRLTADDFAALHAKGTSDSAGVEASYPLLRSRLSNVFLQINGDSKRFDNQANGAVTSHYKLDAFTLGLAGNRFDEFAGGGATSANLAFVQGKLKLGGSPNQASDAASTRTDGSFSKVRYGITRQQALSETFSLAASLAGQYASKKPGFVGKILSRRPVRRACVSRQRGRRQQWPAGEPGSARAPAGQPVRDRVLRLGPRDGQPRQRFRGRRPHQRLRAQGRGSRTELGRPVQAELQGSVGAPDRVQPEPEPERQRPGRFAAQEPFLAASHAAILRIPRTSS